MTKTNEITLAHTSTTASKKHGIRFVSPLWSIVRAATRRHTAMPVLCEADPHVLKDMGITPQDVYAASASRWWEDPTDKLAHYASERRSA